MRQRLHSSNTQLDSDSFYPFHGVYSAHHQKHSKIRQYMYTYTPYPIDDKTERRTDHDSQLCSSTSRSCNAYDRDKSNRLPCMYLEHPSSTLIENKGKSETVTVAATKETKNRNGKQRLSKGSKETFS